MKLAKRTFRDGKYKITSKFGKRSVIKTPAGVTSTTHKGTDYGTYGIKLPQYALENGIVTRASKDKYGANVIVIEYPRIGKKLTYAHLDKMNVKKGDKVTENTIIGTTGKTGRATGIHLHLGLQKIGSSIYTDPEKYDYEEEPKNNNEWTIGRYKILVDKYMRKSTKIVANNLVKYNSLTEVTKKQCKNKNGYAQFKKGATITITKIIRKDGRIWGEYAGVKRYLVLCNKDKTPQAKKID